VLIHHDRHFQQPPHRPIPVALTAPSTWSLSLPPCFLGIRLSRLLHLQIPHLLNSPRRTPDIECRTTNPSSQTHISAPRSTSHTLPDLPASTPVVPQRTSSTFSGTWRARRRRPHCKTALRSPFPRSCNHRSTRVSVIAQRQADFGACSAFRVLSSSPSSPLGFLEQRAEKGYCTDDTICFG
jgi:hypothetical protein